MYRSAFIKATWNSDAPANTRIICFDSSITKQLTLEASPCRTVIIHAIKRGWPITPIIPSVLAKQPSVTLDLVFSRGFVPTTNMASAFKMVVMGQVIIFIIAMNKSTAQASVIEESSLPPRKLTTSHSVDVPRLLELALEFIFFASLFVSVG